MILEFDGHGHLAVVVHWQRRMYCGSMVRSDIVLISENMGERASAGIDILRLLECHVQLQLVGRDDV